jgi:hypothetical protein
VLVLVSTSALGCGGGVIVPPDGNGSNGNDNNDNVPPPDLVPEVQLTASNVAPMPNEEVELLCRVVNEADGPFTFAFQLALGRLIVDSEAGRAVFIVDASDVGTAIEFTCTAANDAGISDPSNSVIVTATGP